MSSPYRQILTSVIAASAATGSTVQLAEHWDYVGISVPALSPSGTISFQVSSDGASWFNLRDAAGNAVPYWSATVASGNVGNALDMPEAAGILGYEYVRPVLSAATTAALTITFELKRIR